ncbi:MAG: right-handed parallel beta-helix repeat-containing protein [Candidatus Thermoplasmatota archaeon]|nr:right-handed parallel beta-helix repeat-containing protein [Candidatus Thermoplasmatota archaeon]
MNYRYYTSITLIVILAFSVPGQAILHDEYRVSSRVPVMEIVWYVDDDNTLGPWWGTLEFPYQHIQDAIDAGSAQDTIYVFSGLYQETLIVTIPLKILGEDMNQTIIDGEKQPQVVTLAASETILQNFTIRNSAGCDGSAGVVITTTNITIISCVIYRTETAIYAQNSSHVVVADCRIIANGDGLNFYNATDTLLISCYIAQNGLGVHLTGADNISISQCFIHLNGVGAFIKNSSNINFSTCAISNNCDNQGGVFIYGSHDVIITDCNLIHNGVGAKIESSYNISIMHSNLQWNTHFTVMVQRQCEEITISDNDISNNYRYGLHINDADLIVHNNNFYENRLYGIHAELSRCQAQNNWWNSVFGPAVTGLTQADRVSVDMRNILVFPWKYQPVSTSGSSWETEDVFTEYPLPEDTDRAILLLGNDSDNDLVPDWWEEKWGYNPEIWDNHMYLDPDGDGLNNPEECYTDSLGSNPFYKDLFLEFDWTQSENIGETNQPSQQRTDQMIQRFAEHNITLHVDRGTDGGGEEIPLQSKFNYDVLRKLYWQYFLHEDIDNPRKGIYHYGIITDYGPGPGFSFIGWYHHDAFCLSAQGLDESNPLYERDQLILTGSMHELGHTLGLFADDHGGNDNRAAVKPRYMDYWLYRNYKSCMNYRYTWNILDYSDGSHGRGDFDDWGALDFMFFKNTRYDIPS